MSDGAPRPSGHLGAAMAAVNLVTLLEDAIPGVDVEHFAMYQTPDGEARRVRIVELPGLRADEPLVNPFDVDALLLTQAEVLAARMGRLAAAVINRSDARGGDARPIDLRPEACWRCDAAQGETDVGLCPTCHHDLTAG